LQTFQKKKYKTNCIPGPMHGVMTPLFCETFHKLDLVDSWITPFIRLSTHTPKKSSLAKKIYPFIKYNKKTTVQLLTSSDELVTPTIEKLISLGINDININFACPSKTVMNKNGGAGLLNQFGIMNSILQRIKNDFSDINLSIKIRTGINNFNEIENLMTLFLKYNLDFIAVHFRTASEMYDKVYGGFERIKKCVKLATGTNIIASGDIWEIADIDKVCEVSKCHGVMVARGLLKNPFLIREYQGLTFGENKIQLYVETMQNIMKNDVKQYWKRPSYLANLKNLFGESSEEFNIAKRLDEKTLLNYNFFNN